MAKYDTFQSSFVGGIVDRRLADNDGLEVYFNGVADAVNVRPSPQGGMMLRGGLAYCGRHRGAISALDLDGVSVTIAASGSSGGAGTITVPPPPDPTPYPDLPPYAPWRPEEYNVP